VFTIIL